MIESGHSALFNYPDRARLGRKVPKSRIVVAGNPSRRVRDQLTSQVARITWEYKLAPETLNLKGSRAVPEIQVFSVALKSAGVRDELPMDVLKCIDRAINFPLIFELTSSREDGAPRDVIRVAATYKRPSEADASKWVVDNYFATEWLPSNASREQLPIALNLTQLYELMLRELIPLASRKGESIEALTERQSKVSAKQKAYRHLEERVHREKQFNRKVELNQELRALKAELDLIGATKNLGQKKHG